MAAGFEPYCPAAIVADTAVYMKHVYRYSRCKSIRDAGMIAQSSNFPIDCMTVHHASYDAAPNLFHKFYMLAVMKTKIR